MYNMNAVTSHAGFNKLLIFKYQFLLLHNYIPVFGLETMVTVKWRIYILFLERVLAHCSRQWSMVCSLQKDLRYPENLPCCYP